jgi:acyl-CoA thioesterase FadM
MRGFFFFALPFITTADHFCHHREGLEYPDIIETGLSIVKLGNSSVTYQIGIFSSGWLRLLDK